MADKQFLVNINLGGNHLKSAYLVTPVVENLAGAPAGSDGQLYYDSGTHQMMAYINGSWEDLMDSNLLPNSVNDTHIDWGSGANQVDTDDIPEGVTNLWNQTHTGDVTGATALTIAADAVTYSKIQNVVGNNVLLGNDNGAGSAVQELTAAEVRAILNVEDGAAADQTITLTGDVTGSGTGSFAATISNDAVTYAKIQNVAANNVLLGNDSGAGSAVQELTDAEVLALLSLDADLQTLSLPASTTISTFGASLIDDADAATARTTLGVDPAGTDNSTDVTLAGSYNYITIAGQVITRNQIDLTTDVTGVLPIGNFATIDDDTFATASATTVPTSESVKAYVDGVITGGMIFRGDYDASTDTPSLDDGTPIAGIVQGDTYVVSVAGDFFTEGVQVGDMLMAKQDSPTLLSHWAVINKNIPDIVDASTTAKGIIEIATLAEVNAGTDTVRAVVPDTLNDWTGNTAISSVGTVTVGNVDAILPTASTTVAGIVELATITETNTGTDATRAVTPDGLDGWIGSAQITTLGTIGTGTWQGDVISNTYLPSASTSAKGVIEIATQAEVNAESSSTLAVTPSTLAGWYSNIAGVTKYTTTTTGGATSEVINHGLGTRNVTFSIWNGTSYEDDVYVVEATDANNLTIRSNTNIAAGVIVTVIG